MIRLATRKRSTGYVLQARACWIAPFPYSFVLKKHSRKGTYNLNWIILHIISRRSRRSSDFNWMPY